MGLEVAAEGVETADQQAFLRLRAASEMQGYYFSKALPLDELAEILNPKSQARSEAPPDTSCKARSLASFGPGASLPQRLLPKRPTGRAISASSATIATGESRSRAAIRRFRRRSTWN